MKQEEDILRGCGKGGAVSHISAVRACICAAKTIRIYRNTSHGKGHEGFYWAGNSETAVPKIYKNAASERQKKKAWSTNTAGHTFTPSFCR